MITSKGNMSKNESYACFLFMHLYFIYASFCFSWNSLLAYNSLTWQKYPEGFQVPGEKDSWDSCQALCRTGTSGCS